MFNFRDLLSYLGTIVITGGIVYLLVTNLVWYYALLGYFVVGIALYVLSGIYEIFDHKRSPWKSYHKGTIFDWWYITLPLSMIGWFLLIELALYDLLEPK